MSRYLKVSQSVLAGSLILCVGCNGTPVGGVEQFAVMVGGRAPSGIFVTYWAAVQVLPPPWIYDIALKSRLLGTMYI